MRGCAEPSLAVMKLLQLKSCVSMNYSSKFFTNNASKGNINSSMKRNILSIFFWEKKKKRFHISEFPSLLWLRLQVVSHVSHYHPFNGKTSRVLEEQKKRNCSAYIWEGKRGNKQLKKRYLAFKFSKAYGTDMLLSANIWKTSA